ncbi:ATP-grasp domain-containing protein [Streptomyces sp. NPDC051776]|uniref:ATP-grasp domain-containing protein n=1 Tax=Streptomyces sp. NPDC051776 TaxID=3155414 RepID=UPI00344AD0CC
MGTKRTDTIDRTDTKDRTDASGGRTLLIIGGRVETVCKARELGLRVVNVQRPEEYRPEHAELVEAALLADYTDWSVLRPLVTAAHEVFGFSGVATITEPGVEPVGLISDALGLPGNSHRCARLMRDKEAMRLHLSWRADAVAAGAVTDGAALSDFGARHGYPFIVKPVDAAASFGVRKVEGPEAVEDVWRAITDLRGRTDHLFATYFPVDRFLMEEYLDGPEFSVESLSFDGRHVPLAVTEKTTLGSFVESGHAMPARLPSVDEEAVIRCAVESLDALGLRHGPAHTEVKLTERGPRLIESHGRPGGDRIMDLVEAAYGVDIESYASGWAAGVLPPLEGPPEPRAAAATRFLTAEPGRVTAIEGDTDVREHENVLGVDVSVATGDTIRPLEASWDRVGQVLVTGPDTDAAVALGEQLAGKISVITTPDGG